MNIDPSPAADPAPGAATEDPGAAYRAALGRYEGARLVEILRGLGPLERVPKPAALPDAVAERLASPRVVEEVVRGLGEAPRAALGLLGFVEAPSWPAVGLAQSLALLGIEPAEAIRPLLERGLLAARGGSLRPQVADFAGLLRGEIPPDLVLIAHPEARAAARPVLPGGPGPARSGPARQAREADGLEPILRLAALWQRVDETPLRQTQQGALYKRDRDRLEDDPVLAGPIADAPEPLPDMVPLWLALARGVGLLADVPGTDRVAAAPADYWAEHAVHLPQMVAARWLGLASWHEQAGMQADDATTTLALPFARPAALLWLATLGEGEWVALEDLAEHFHRHAPGWERPALAGPDLPPAAPRPGPGKGKASRRGAAEPRAAGPLEAMLLGPAYLLGLVRAAEEDPGGRRIVQLSPLGRYVLAMGPPPAPRPSFEHFLFVQPNFEIIAYRQGLSPSLIGQFSRFARWTQLGAALELRLTPESVYRALEGGMTPEAMLDRLGRHSARPLPAGVAEALRTWSGRRERVSYHAAATLIEFASPEALQAALAAWADEGRPPPVPVSDRLLLVEDDASIPFRRFRLTGSRDYRRPPEVCVEVEPDGVTLALDPGRADLFVDAELSRFADELPRDDSAGLFRRRFRVGPASLARGVEDGQTPATLARWFAQRTGGDLPPALRLLLHAQAPRVEPLRSSRPLVLHVPSPDLLDGLAQHPATRDALGERLGPTTVVVPDGAIDRLKAGLSRIGLTVQDTDGSAHGQAGDPRRPERGRRHADPEGPQQPADDVRPGPAASQASQSPAGQ
jgi:hypothetical protein